MSTKDEAMKLALEALEGVWKGGFSFPHVDCIRKAITALREALAEQPAQQKPVNQRAHEMALRQWDHWKQYALELQEKLVKYEGGAQMILNTSPQPAHRKPLTPEKVVKLKDAFYAGFESYVTPAAPCSDVDEEWAKYKSAHNIKENT